MKKFIAIVVLFVSPLCAESYQYNSYGNQDSVYGSDGYTGNGVQVGNMYYYSDNQGNSYYQDTTSGNANYRNSSGDSYNKTTVGGNDYISGSNGYSGGGYWSGNTYIYYDNR